MRTRPLPTPATLRKFLRYEPETGRLFWRERTPDDFGDGKRAKEHTCTKWNARFAGKEGFTATDDKGYKLSAFSGKMMKAHRVAWAICKGKWPDGEIDHINGDPSDNRIENLRDVSTSVNQRNQKRNQKNTSGHTGVVWDKAISKWNSRGKINGKQIHLGCFEDIEDAIQARKDFNRRNGYTDRHGEQDFILD